MRIILFTLVFILPSHSIGQSKKSHLRDGNKLYKDSLFNDAETKYRKSLEKDQEYFSASYNLANAVYKQERFQESSALYDGLKDNAKNKKELSKIYHNLGNSFFKQQQLKNSIASYKNALRNNPHDEDTRHNLALAQKMLKKQEQEQQEENKDENKKQEQEQQEEKVDMSKETAEKMLEALQQEEKKLQEKLQKKKNKGKKIKVLKDW